MIRAQAGRRWDSRWAGFQSCRAGDYCSPPGSKRMVGKAARCDLRPITSRLGTDQFHDVIRKYFRARLAVVQVECPIIDTM